MRWWLRSVTALLLLVLAAVLALVVYAWRALPTTSGELHLAGAQGEIRIERDEHGIPTVHAQSLRDASFALGVLHAQDRLWQLETHRRIAAGRTAEVFGEAALPNDRFLRALGIRRTAAAQWQLADAHSREQLDAYAAGVNAVIASELRARPPEFVILGVHPEPWTPIDSLGWGTMMAWDLGGNWRTELFRLRLAMTMPRQRIDELLPPYPGEQALPAGDYPALYRSLGLAKNGTAVSWSRLPDQAPPSGVEGVGSNNWVLAPSRTTTGAPLLANDPHLGLTTPALWYFVRLKLPGLEAAGASLPGLPSIVLGQNRHLAWGMTNTGPDVQDLYIEEIDPADPKRYRTPDGWALFEVADEVIRVKGKPDVPIQVRRTRHGPVISDAGTLPDVFGEKTRARHALAMRWTALDGDAGNFGAGLRMLSADSVAAFVAATEGWMAPMQNIIVADRAGRIAFVAAGRVPLRKPDNDLHGLAPAPGWDARYDWDGWLPATQTPRELDPPAGAIATANQRIHAPDYPHFISSDWALPYRQQRIEAMLAAKPRHGIDDLAAMQADIKSLAVPGVLPWLQKVKSNHPLATAALQQLAAFDGTMAADRAAPLIFWAWQRQLAENLFIDEIGPEVWDRSAATRTFRDSIEPVLSGPAAHWCDDRRTSAVETCEQIVERAFSLALDELSARFDPNPSRWRWGDAHPMRAEHRPFSRVKGLARLFELRVPTGGDTFTVNVSRVGLRADATTGERYLNEHGPSLRAIYDVGNPAQSRFMHSTGQSGILFSPWYRNFVVPWAATSYVPLWPAPGTPQRTLVIRPAGASG